jgi:hypothetical protein
VEVRAAGPPQQAGLGRGGEHGERPNGQIAEVREPVRRVVAAQGNPGAHPNLSNLRILGQKVVAQVASWKTAQVDHWKF